MPLIGLVGEHSWRYGWLALPLVAALLAAAALVAAARGSAGRDAAAAARAALGDPRAGALAGIASCSPTPPGRARSSTRARSSSSRTAPPPELTGVVLALGGLRVRRRQPDLPAPRPARSAAASGRSRSRLPSTTRSSVLVRGTSAVSTALFSLAAFVAGGRTLVTSTFALAAPPELRPAVTSLRAATMQFGYFAGSFVGGARARPGRLRRPRRHDGPASSARRMPRDGRCGAPRCTRARRLSPSTHGLEHRVVLASPTRRWSFGSSARSRSSTAPHRCRSRRASSGRCWRCLLLQREPHRRTRAASSTTSGARRCRSLRRRWCRSTSRSCARRCPSRDSTRVRPATCSRSATTSSTSPASSARSPTPARRSRRARPSEARALLGDALALWRGRALAEFSEPFARHESARLEELRVAALEWRIEADLALGHHARRRSASSRR